MKKILKEIERIMSGSIYSEYRLIISNNHIELKITPKSNSIDEVNFSVKNNREDRLHLLIQLEKI